MNAALRGIDCQEVPDMTILESIQQGFAELKGLLSSKLSLSDDLTKAKAEAADLKATVGRQEEEISNFKAKALEATTKADADAKAIVDLQASLTARDQEIATLKAAAKSAGQQAAEMLSNAGVAAGKTPETKPGGAEDLESVRKAMAQEKDPKKKGELAIKARELRGHGGLFKATEAAK